MADFRLDSDGIKALLNSDEVAAAIHDIADRVAANVRGARPEADVVVDTYTTDRRAASVTIREAYARRLVVRDGLLIRQAAAEGLEVTSKVD